MNDQMLSQKPRKKTADECYLLAVENGKFSPSKFIEIISNNKGGFTPYTDKTQITEVRREETKDVSTDIKKPEKVKLDFDVIFPDSLTTPTKKENEKPVFTCSRCGAITNGGLCGNCQSIVDAVPYSPEYKEVMSWQEVYYDYTSRFGPNGIAYYPGGFGNGIYEDEFGNKRYGKP